MTFFAVKISKMLRGLELHRRCHKGISSTAAICAAVNRDTENQIWPGQKQLTPEW
jgi:hypothetical protein